MEGASNRNCIQIWTFIIIKYFRNSDSKNFILQNSFKTNHIPLALNSFLYNLEQGRPEEWQLILYLFEKNQNFVHLLREKDENFDKWMSKIMSWTFGQLFQLCLTNLPCENEIIRILYDLVEDYIPIKLSLECLEKRTVTKNLGDEVTINIEAEGAPSLEYHWFFWPKNGSNDWIPIGKYYLNLA